MSGAPVLKTALRGLSRRSALASPQIRGHETFDNERAARAQDPMLLRDGPNPSSGIEMASAMHIENRAKRRIGKRQVRGIGKHSAAEPTQCMKRHIQRDNLEAGGF